MTPVGSINFVTVTFISGNSSPPKRLPSMISTARSFWLRLARLAVRYHTLVARSCGSIAAAVQQLRLTFHVAAVFDATPADLLRTEIRSLLETAEPDATVRVERVERVEYASVCLSWNELNEFCVHLFLLRVADRVPNQAIRINSARNAFRNRTHGASAEETSDNATAMGFAVCRAVPARFGRDGQRRMRVGAVGRSL